jgi:hypothetical protein
MLERFAAELVARVQALIADNVFPAPDVDVDLVLIGPDDISAGVIVGGTVTHTSVTNEFGQYQVQLNFDTTADTCRYLVQVGSASDGTLTRAFVFSTTEPVNIDFQSEATVRLILEEIAAGEADLCEFDADDIASIHGAVVDSDQVVSGNTIAELNAAATSAAANDPNVQAAIADAIGQPTVVPATATNTPQPTATRTPTSNATGTPTQTITVRPTRTDTPTPESETPTAEPTVTSSVTQTPTGTPLITVTSTATSVATATVPMPTATFTVVPPTATFTVAPPTATVSPDATFTNTPTLTPTRTNTPTVTPTATMPDTPTSTPTLTPTESLIPEVNLGLGSGTAAVFVGAAGATVEIPVSLVTRDVSLSAIANDIDFDGTFLRVRMIKGMPDCVVEPDLMDSKSIFALVSDLGGGLTRLRVGFVAKDNNSELPDGVLYRCRFEIDINAPSGGIALSNVPSASSPQGDDVFVIGNDGRIEVEGAGATLGLSAGTAGAGATVSVSATLHARGAELSAIATDIEFDPALVTVADDGSGPDCEIDPSIGSGTVLDKEIFSIVGDAEVSGLQILRIGLVSRENNLVLPEESSEGLGVFTCRFVVQAASGTISLQQSASGSDPSGQEVGLVGVPGTITVQ